MNNRVFAKSIFVVFIFALLTGLSGYVLRITLARNLSIENFGLFYSVITLFFFISYIVDAGISYSLSKKIIEFRIRKKKNAIKNIFFTTLLIQLVLSVFIALILVIFRSTLSINYFHANANILVLLMSAWLLLLPLYMCLTSLFYGFDSVVSYSFIDVLKSLILLFGSIFFIFLGYGILSGAIAYILSLIISIIVMLVWMKKIYPMSFNFKLDIKNSKEVIYFGIFILLSNFLWTIITQIDTLVVTYFTNPTGVAMYQIGIATSSILLFFTNAVVMVLFPKISELKESKKIRQISSTITLIYKYLSIILIPLIIAMFLFPDIIINLLFTSKYFGAIGVLKILAISVLFSSITIVNNTLLIASGKPKLVIRNMLFITLLNIVLNIVLVSKYGIIGAAISTLISFICSAIISSSSIHRNISFKYPFRTWIIMVILIPIFLLLLTYIKKYFIIDGYFEMGVLFSIFGIIYLGILLLVKEINLKQLILLIKK